MRQKLQQPLAFTCRIFARRWQKETTVNPLELVTLRSGEKITRPDVEFTMSTLTTFYEKDPAAYRDMVNLCCFHRHLVLLPHQTREKLVKRGLIFDDELEPFVCGVVTSATKFNKGVPTIVDPVAT